MKKYSNFKKELRECSIEHNIRLEYIFLKIKLDSDYQCTVLLNISLDILQGVLQD